MKNFLKRLFLPNTTKTMPNFFKQPKFSFTDVNNIETKTDTTDHSNTKTQNQDNTNTQKEKKTQKKQPAEKKENTEQLDKSKEAEELISQIKEEKNNDSTIKIETNNNKKENKTVKTKENKKEDENKANKQDKKPEVKKESLKQKKEEIKATPIVDSPNDIFKKAFDRFKDNWKDVTIDNEEKKLEEMSQGMTPSQKEYLQLLGNKFINFNSYQLAYFNNLLKERVMKNTGLSEIDIHTDFASLYQSENVQRMNPDYFIQQEHMSEFTKWLRSKAAPGIKVAQKESQKDQVKEEKKEEKKEVY